MSLSLLAYLFNNYSPAIYSENKLNEIKQFFSHCDLCCWEGAVVPSCIRLEEHLQQIDAGLMLNMPVPPFLGEKRDIDLLIALDYGADDTFKVKPLYNKVNINATKERQIS